MPSLATILPATPPSETREQTVGHIGVRRLTPGSSLVLPQSGGGLVRGGGQVGGTGGARWVVLGWAVTQASTASKDPCLHCLTPSAGRRPVC